MASNRVAANLVMPAIVAEGLVSLNGIAFEAWPTLPFNTIEVPRSYPGAMPEEVEESIGVKIEEQVSSLDDAIPRYGKEYATKRELSHPLARPVSRWPAHYQTGATTFVSQRLDER